MKEITAIHIARVPFRIERTAYQHLQKYLEAIEQVTKQEHRDDILSEIESRIVEILAERGIKKDGTITDIDIDALKNQLGEPVEFSEENDDDKLTSTAKNSKAQGQFSRPFLRDSKNGMVAGVCYGIGKYYADPPAL